MIVIFPAADERPRRRGARLLLAHCAAFDLERDGRASARERLEALLGVDLAGRLLRLAAVYGSRRV